MTKVQNQESKHLECLLNQIIPSYVQMELTNTSSASKIATKIAIMMVFGLTYRIVLVWINFLTHFFVSFAFIFVRDILRLKLNVATVLVRSSAG